MDLVRSDKVITAKPPRGTIAKLKKKIIALQSFASDKEATLHVDLTNNI